MGSRRYKVKWIDQNVVEVEDLQIDDLFYMNGDVKVLDRHRELEKNREEGESGEGEANVFFEGFLAGVDFCNSQLKHCDHNFIWRE